MSGLREGGRLVLMVAPVAAVGWALWQWDRLNTAERIATTVSAGAEQTLERAEQIRELSAQPRRAAEIAEAASRASELFARLESAVTAAGLDRSSLGGIEPTPRPQRLGDSPYAETVVTVRLRRVPLRGLTEFLHRVKADPARPAIKEVRLTADPSDHRLWSAEVRLALLLYDPR